MKEFIIDHFKGSYAICKGEDKSDINIPKYKLPLDCKEGDCLIINSNGMYQKNNVSLKDKKNNLQKKNIRILNS